RQFLYLGAQSPQLGCQSDNAIRLLVSNVRDVADARRTVGKASDRGKGHDGIANVVHVHVDAAERAAVNGDAGFALLYAATHLLKNVDETDVALEAVLGQAGDGDAAAEDRGGGPEIGGGGGVGFDGIPSWTVVSACRSDAVDVSLDLLDLVVPQPHH